MDNKQLAQNNYDDRKKIDNASTWMIIILSIVVILFLISTVVLGSRLYKMATNDQRTVDLELGNPEGSIELFRIEYANETGEITVKGANTDNVIAPGTSVDYNISLRNNDDVIIDFLMTPRIEFFGEHRVPVEFKVMDSHGNYILGNDDTWVSPEQMNELAHKNSIHPGEIYTYHVTWRWIFELDNAQNDSDTALGNQNGEVIPGVCVSIETHSAANMLPVKSNTHMMHFSGESFGCCWCCYILLPVLLACILLIILVRRLRKKFNDLKSHCEMFPSDVDECKANVTEGAAAMPDESSNE